MKGGCKRGALSGANVKGQMDQELHYDEIKGWIEKVAL